jgi:glycerol kinase
MRVLAIDQGTSSTKALVVDDDGSVLAQHEIAVHPVALDDTPEGHGGVEQDPEELWRSVVDAGMGALAAVGSPVDAVALANQGETVLAWDRATGAPLAPALVWQDRRSAAVCERLAADRWDERLAALTGLELDPYFVAPKITWLRENVTRDGVATTTDTWLLHRLCGAFVTDAATASRSLVLDLDAVTWSDDACDAFGIDATTLPDIVTCAEAVGETTVFSGAVSGASASGALPVVGLAVDQQAALFAERCLEPGEAKCTYGTGAFLLATIGAKARRSTSGLVACVAWQLPGAGGTRETTYCLDGQVYTVGAAVGWLTEIGVIEHASDLDRLGSTVSGTGGATFVPALAGLAAPFWKPNARGAFTGLSLATGRAELVRALVEGIAAQCGWLARGAGTDLGAPLTRLRVDGGLTQSRLLMQVQADLLQAPVEVYASPHATALGVAAFARLGAGAAATAADAVGSWKPSAVYEPTISHDEAEERLERWRAAAEATQSL